MGRKYNKDYERIIRFIGHDNQLKHICLNYVNVSLVNELECSDDELLYIKSAKDYYRTTLILNMMCRVNMFEVFNYSIEYYFKCMVDYYNYTLNKEEVIFCTNFGSVIYYEHKDNGFSQVELELIGKDNILGIEKYIVNILIEGFDEDNKKYVLDEMDNGLPAQLAYEKGLDIEYYGHSKLNKMVDDLLDSL